MDKQTLCVDDCDIGTVGKFSVSGKVRDNSIVLACEVCGKKFASRQDQPGKYCSRPCAQEGSRNRIEVPCDMCGKLYSAKPSKLRISSFHFCSRECKDKAQRISSGVKFDSLRPKHYGSGDASSRYRKIAFAALPHICADCGWEQIPNILEVHHIDRDHGNADIDNLVLLCPTCHVVRHYLAQDGKFKKKKGAMV